MIDVEPGKLPVDLFIGLVVYQLSNKEHLDALVGLHHHDLGLSIINKDFLLSFV